MISFSTPRKSLTRGAFKAAKLCTGLVFVALLAACSSNQQMAGIGPGDSVDSIRNTNLTAYFPIPTGGPTSRKTASGAMVYPGSETNGAQSSSQNGSFQAATYNGADANPAALPAAGTTAGDDGVEINFESAEIQVVAKTILTDTLGLNFTIDPRVQSTITMVSAGPIPKKDVLAVFESVLRMTNDVLIRQGNMYKIAPMQEATGLGAVEAGARQPGFGVSIIPLRYASAAGLAKTAEGFLSRQGAVRADPTRNLLLVQGTQAERQAVLDMARGFDVEWLRHQSVGIYPLKTTAPDIMVKELERIFETAEGGQGQGLVSFQPINRMNAVMAVARNAKTLERVTQWVSRLDRENVTSSTVRIYRLEHGSAAKVAKILNDIFIGKGGNGGNASDTAAASQVAPGSNAAQSKLDSVGQNASSGSNNSSSNSSNGTGGAQLTSSNSSSSNASSFSDFADGASKKGDADSTGGSLPKGVFQNVRITADTGNNSIIVYSNQDDYRVIERSIRELDRPQLQVAIEATIAEVTLTDALSYGVQYYLGSSNVGLASDKGSVSLTTSAATAAIAQSLPGLNVLLGSQASPKVILSALSTLTSVKVLSAPSLVVTDNQPAYLQVGDSVPISTGSATVLSSANTIVNTITMQDTGVIMKVWPHVHANGAVDLEIEQQVSSVVGGVSATTTNLNPTISQRRIHSTISVQSGQTVLLGGLMSEADNKTQDGIPVLRQITGLGDLFGNTNGSKARTEIIVFVKPTVIRDGGDASSVAEEFRSKLSTMHAARPIISGVADTRVTK